MKTPALLALSLALAGADAHALEVRNYDALAEAKAWTAAAPPVQRAFAQHASVAHREDRLGVPTFVWAAFDAKGEQPWLLGSVADLRPEQAARRYLWELAELYRLSSRDVEQARVHEVHDTGMGGIIVRFRQRVEGVEVFRNELNVLLDRQLRLIAVTGYLSPLSSSAKTVADGFRLTAQAAVASAVVDLTGALVEPGAVLATERRKGDYEYFRLAPDAQLPFVPTKDVRVKQALFSLPGELVPAYYLELKLSERASTSSEYVSYVVSARDGAVLFRNDLSSHAAASYRVWADPASLIPHDGPQGTVVTPHPTGSPGTPTTTWAAPDLISLDHAGLSTSDPWLAAGVTKTNGNNARAYADLASPDGFTSGDLEADMTSAGSFDRAYDVTADPNASASQRQAAVTQLFYNVNFFHDWFYDVGFTEVAGNAQASNYTRGGVGGDPLLAEAQDYSGTNNANMQTPADGESPVMQMYVFETSATTTLNVTAPSSIAGPLQTNLAQFGPTTWTLTGKPVQLVNDGVAPSEDGCEPLAVGALTGKIALIKRGACTFGQKVENAQRAGALAAIIYNNQSGAPPPLYGSSTATIPAVSITDVAGGQLVGAMTGGSQVIVDLTRMRSGLSRDGTLDNTIVAHEWGHYISNRLIGDGNGLNNVQGGGLGEGWGDFHALLMVVRADDLALNPTPAWSGVYPLATYAMGANEPQAYYYGIRRVPYSTRFDKNPLTLKHIQDGVTLPSTAPIAGGTDGSANSEVHNSGEIWCAMLWEAYAALLSDSQRLTFAQAQQRIKSYLVGGYKLTPVSPTFLEARDAVLAAAYAGDPADYALVAAAFARRGAGINAVAPDRNSYNNAPTVEDFTTGGNLVFVDASVKDDVTTCDADGLLDNAETGTITVRVKNIGTSSLTQTTGQVSSSLTQLTFPQGSQLTFPTSAPMQIVSATVRVSASGLTGMAQLPFSFSFTDPGLANPRTLTGQLDVRGNFDQLNSASSADDVEAVDTAWSRAYDGRYTNDHPFWRMNEAGNTHWMAPNAPQPEGQYLVSPKLTVAPAGNLVVTYKNRWEFEADANNNYDGAVLELKIDGTNTWIDIGKLAQPGYNGTLMLGTQTPRGLWPSANPLRGRQAWVQASANYPAWVTTTVNLGTQYAGKTVQIRFRVGSDEAAGATGWEIDDIAFTGISNRPFATVVEQGPICNDRRPTANAGLPQQVEEGQPLTLAGTASDPEGKPLTYAWTQLSGPAGTLSGETTLSPTFTAPRVSKDERVVLKLIANDGAQNSLPSTVEVLIKNVNHKPVAKVVTPVEALAGAFVTLDGSGSFDPDDDALAYRWRQVGGMDVTTSATNEKLLTFTAPNSPAGTQLLFALDVQDAVTMSDTSAVVVVTIVAPKVEETPGDPSTPADPKVGGSGCGCSSTADVSASLALLALATLIFRARRRAEAGLRS